MLSDKEQEVLKLRKQGLKQSEIAKKLRISQPAVSSFEKNAYRKIREAGELLEIIKKLGIDMP
ncbi:helix-turn-helix domain-containing protein [Candidatus Woesearchaeota archaeon]|nr:helix-turn-helix domain-containing protein [Candidatus Woesearchaeota archaeon]